MTAEKAPETRDRIISAAADLLVDEGLDALSTRAICAAAGVQAPTLYRIFGDKDGLLDAVAAFGFERYLADKRSLTHTDDPVADLRRGWDLHVDFGLTHPAFYVLMYGSVRPGHRPPVAEETDALLITLVERVAEAGRLRVPVPAAAEMVHAAGVGVTLSLIGTPNGRADTGVSARTREAVMSAITVDAAAAEDGDATLTTRALWLDRALARRPTGLSAAEVDLLREWLRRLADESSR